MSYNDDGSLNPKGDGSGSSGSSIGANPAIGSVVTAISAAGTGITNGIAADDFNNQLKAGTKKVSGAIAAQTADYDSIIAKLQGKIAALNAQIEALNAQKLKQ